ncbi:hypothetical protein Taro_047303, partial [Colocasia esculenta]|nr:hypothetical protein [Colocasia esculenta]
CNKDSPTGNNDSSSPQREREQRQSKQHEAALGRTSTKGAKSRPGRTSPERTPTKRHTLNYRGNTTHDRNKHEAILRETLTRTITNSSGKPHQNTGQPSNAPQPRGQCNSNQKRAQHSSGETSLPPEPTKKNSGSTSPELTTSQHQADNNHRQASQCSTSDATRHTGPLLSPSNNAD